MCICMGRGVAVGVPAMTHRASTTPVRVDGAQGLALYRQWQSSRAPDAAFITCQLTGPVSELGSQWGEMRDISWEERARLKHFAHLDRLYPAASLPGNPRDCLEFEQRCWWLGISLTQGAFLRAHNRKEGLCWP